MSPKLEAAIQSFIIAAGGVASALGVISADQQTTIANVTATAVGLVFTIIGAVWNHTSAQAGVQK